MGFAAGPMRLRVDLERPVERRDERGHDSSTPEVYARGVPAAIVPAGGSETADAQSVRAEQQLRVRIRYRADVHPRHTLVLNGRRLHIVHAENWQERNRWLLLSCGEHRDAE